MRIRTIAVLLLAAVVLPVLVFARSHHKHRENGDSHFDYYLLSLSYAPDFCDQRSGNQNSAECGSGRHTGFVVHGLWPQNEEGRGPERCAPSSPVSADLVRIMLNYIPTESLIQHEWTDHGTCSGLSASDYFGLVRKARDSVKIPGEFQGPSSVIQISPQDFQAKFASANPAFPPDAFRASCYRNGELQEARICFSKDLNARACGASAGSCPAGAMTVLPVR